MNFFKKPWVSLLLILGAGGLGIAGTFAYFTATRTAETNTFEAGTLDLSVTGDNNTANEPFVIENMGANANMSGTKTWTVTNTGSLPGRLLVRIANLANQENGCNDQEKGAEPECEATTEGELGGVITLNVALDGETKTSSTLATANVQAIGDAWNDDIEPVILQPNETRTVTMSWATAEDEYGNEIQSDSLTFDSVFQLIQLLEGPTPANR